LPAGNRRKIAMTLVKSLTDEVPEGESWLWPQRVGLGALTLLVGDPGVGKSYLALDLAARLSRGGRWPDEELSGSSSEIASAPPAREPGGTFILSAEDNYFDTVRPRLETLGADLTNIAVLSDDEHRQAFNLLPMLPRIERQIEAEANVRLWIIDPISAYLGGLQENQDRSVRGLLNPLANLAAARRLAIVLVTHLAKGDGTALHRVLGSRAFGAAARNVWLVSYDADASHRRLLLPVKSNRTTPPTGLAFTLEPAGDSGYAKLHWAAEPVSASANDTLQATAYEPPPRDQLRRQVIAWLEETLAAGPLLADTVRKSAEVDGIAYTTLRRAFREMGGQSMLQKNGRKTVRLWQLAPEAAVE
jgi:hypothetical protein